MPWFCSHSLLLLIIFSIHQSEAPEAHHRQGLQCRGVHEGDGGEGEDDGLHGAVFLRAELTDAQGGRGQALFLHLFFEKKMLLSIRVLCSILSPILVFFFHFGPFFFHGCSLGKKDGCMVCSWLTEVTSHWSRCSFKPRNSLLAICRDMPIHCLF